MKKSIVFSILIILLCSFSLLNKNYFAELVNERLEAYSSTFAPEKVYVHTDKPYYAIDDTIWFSSYLVDGVTHEKAEKSWVVHVDLFNGADSLVSNKKLFTNLYSVAGDIKIDENWTPGTYTLRAYTRYMRNESPDYFFKKDIKILDINQIDSAATTKKPTDVTKKNFKQIKPNLQFYPEGGHLVEGLRSKVAIKAKGVGLGDVHFSGSIMNNKNEVISTFSTAEFGLGIVTLSPRSSERYFAKLEVNGVEYTYELPKALPNGYTLGALNTGKTTIVNVASNTSTGLLNTYLVGHQRGKLVVGKFQEEQTNNYTFKIPTATLKNGVMHLTLFNATGNPVCERLLFVNNNNNKATIEIKKEKETLGNRQKQTVTLTAKDNNGNALPSFLSMSVRDLNAFPHNRFNENIKTYLLLNSDLRGKIESPGYFFDGEFTNKKRYLLDLVMLTNGWRRFTWKDLLFEDKKNKFAPEKGIYITGKTQRLKKPYGPIPSSTRLTFYGEQNIAQEPVVKTDATGRFEFGPFIFFDTIQTIVESRITNFKSKNDKDRELLILIDSEQEEPPALDTASLSKPEGSENLQLDNYLKVTKYVQQLNLELNQKLQKLDEVTVIAKKEAEDVLRTEVLNNKTDYGYPTRRLDLEKDFPESGQTVFDMLNLIPNVNAFNNAVTIRRGTGTPLILLDKFPIDVEFLQTIMANEVSFIDVLIGADAAFYPRSGNGVIAIYSKTGFSSISSRNVKRKLGIIDFTAQGFYTAKTFYAPDHSSYFNASRADIRTTLHWEPRIIVNSPLGKEISFYTSDSDSDYIVEVQGISQSGIPLYGITTFLVE